MPEWFYESEIETLSDHELVQDGQKAMEDLTGRSASIAKGM